VTRLSPLPIEQWDDAARAVLPTYLRRPELYLSGPDALPMPQALGLLAHHVPLGEAWLAFNQVLVQAATLDAQIRELIILRVAWRTRATYEWAQHTRIGLQAGLTVEQLHAVPEGAGAEVWSPVERALLAATDQMVDRHRVDDATWNELGDHFDDTQLLELLFVAGAYICFAVITTSARMKPDPPTEPVDAPVLLEAEG
jgi:4-carboxymuconolactone decarboxylase